MAISYSGNFLRLLLRWKESIWRSIWKELIVDMTMFYAIRFVYVVGFDMIFDDNDDDQWKRKFQAICRMFNEYTKLVPLTFPLGFYLSNATRWWRQFEYLSWREDLVSILCLKFYAQDEKSQMWRQHIARYINLFTARLDKLKNTIKSTKDTNFNTYMPPNNRSRNKTPAGIELWSHGRAQRRLSFG